MTREDVSFGDGQILRGILTFDESVENQSIVIMLHDFHSNKDHDLIADLSFSFQQAQIASLRFDFLGHGDSDGLFEEHTISTQVRDCKQAVMFVHKRFPDSKIFLLGHGVGGNIAILAANSKMIAGLIILGSRARLKDHISSYFTENDLREIDESGYLDHVQGRFYKKHFDNILKHNILSSVEKLNCPVLVVQGTHDMRVPYENAKDLFSKATAKKQIYLVDGADHIFSGSEKRTEVSTQIIGWIRSSVDS